MVAASGGYGPPNRSRFSAKPGLTAGLFCWQRGNDYIFEERTMTDRYFVEQEANGTWMVHDRSTGNAAENSGKLMTEMAASEADDVARLLNTKQQGREEKLLSPDV